MESEKQHHASAVNVPRMTSDEGVHYLTLYTPALCSLLEKIDRTRFKTIDMQRYLNRFELFSIVGKLFQSFSIVMNREDT